MILQIFEDKDLSHLSYIVGDEITKDVVIIDPKRDISEYIQYIQQYSLNLKYILNTHPHADFVSGHKILSEYYSIPFVYHQSVQVDDSSCLLVEEEDRLEISREFFIDIIHTPSHTPFCISFVVVEDNIQKALFSGDFIFNGAMGRADLLGDSTKEKLLALSFQSVQKIIQLPEYLLICPSHNAGSFCGTGLKSNSLTTLGIEKQINSNLSLYLDKEAYISSLDQKIETPPHFFKMGAINIKGASYVSQLRESSSNDSGIQILEIKD
jgi:hydroxyacylglutathione hydrolase